LRDFLDIYAFETVEEFETLCAMLVESEKERGRRALAMRLGWPAESTSDAAMVLL
jgi:hypothetical protein